MEEAKEEEDTRIREEVECIKGRRHGSKRRSKLGNQTHSRRGGLNEVVLYAKARERCGAEKKGAGEGNPEKENSEKRK